MIRSVRFGRTIPGQIESIDLGDRRYEFTVDPAGLVTEICHPPALPKKGEW